MRTRFTRLIIFFLTLLALSLVVLSFAMPYIGGWIFPGMSFAPPRGPTPPPPTLAVPAGPLPTHVGGLIEMVLIPERGDWWGGCGFFFYLPDGRLVATTTAHGVGTVGVDVHITNMRFHPNNRPEEAVLLTHLWGPPGVPRLGDDVTIDYILLQVPAESTAQAAAWALTPDPRGASEPGERVALFSGIGDGAGGPRQLAGTTLAVDAKGVWVAMDENFEPGGMSGSPFISLHTGQVVGMVIAALRRDGKVWMNYHPISSLIQKAEAATTFPALDGYRP